MTALGYLIAGVVSPALRRFFLQPFPRQFNRFVKFLLQQFAFWYFCHILAHFCVEITLKVIFERDYFNKMTPTQLSRQCHDNFPSVLRTLFLQNILADTVADLPVEPHGQDRATT